RLLTGDASAPAGTPANVYDQYKYIDLIQFSQGGPCGWFTFKPVVLSILILLDWIHKIPHVNYGVAIIILVIVVRLLLHPLTRYGQVNMAVMQKKMAVAQPEI